MSLTSLKVSRGTFYSAIQKSNLLSSHFDENKSLKKLFDVVDHSVSEETFELLHDEELDMLMTHPQPQLGELSKYYESQDYISHTDAKRNVFERVYHIVRSYTLKKKVRLIEINRSSQSKRLLDVGCGTGDFLKKAHGHGWDIVGVEPDEDARKIASDKNGPVILESTDLMNTTDNGFDIITLWHVLEHLPDFDEQLRKFHRLLKKDGKLIIAVPNFKSYDAGYYKAYWAAFDVPRHLWHFSRQAMELISKKNDLTVQKILPMKFDAYYVSMLSEKIKTGKLNFLKALTIGFISNLRARGNGEYSSLIYVLEKEKTGNNAI